MIIQISLQNTLPKHFCKSVHLCFLSSLLRLSYKPTRNKKSIIENKQQTKYYNRQLDHNLKSIVGKKLLQLFYYFSAYTETENYKLICKSQFRHFIKWGKNCITWHILWPILSFNSKRPQNISVIFDFSLLE